MKKEIDKKHRILILGASGFIGENLYKMHAITMEPILMA